jgi:serine/threonine-protein kinase
MAGDGEPRDLFVKGQRIDRYEIREHVGQGGMGAVYRAVDTKLGRTVALKTVAAHQRGDKLTVEIRERFMREALAASRVDHRNVVQVLDFGFADDGTPYMVMEFLRGQSLAALLKGAKEALPIDGVADIMLSVCAALRACHHAGIIHRDLKPANIFLCDIDTGWEIKVLDFGISKTTAADTLTQDGQIIGTPHYLSPEQIDGHVVPQTDQYALGVLLYVCLTRQLPHGGHHGAGLLRAISGGAFDPPRTLRPDLPERLESIVLRAMRVSPLERFESAHALGQHLWEFASPRAQRQWKTFYFHAPAVPQPKPGTTTDEAERRAIPQPRPARDLPAAVDWPGVDATASLGPDAGATGSESASRPTIGPAAYAVTRTFAAPRVPGAATPPLPRAAGGGGAGDGQRPKRAARWRVALVVAALAGAGVVAVQHASRTGRPDAQQTRDSPAPR